MTNTHSVSLITHTLLKSMSNTDDPNACWEWQGTRRKGYGRVIIGARTFSVHRLMYEDLYGPLSEDLVVMHAVCDNPPCGNPDHLKAGTQAENLEDMYRKGRSKIFTPPTGYNYPTHPRPQGESHANAKMTNAVVKEMRYLYSSGQLNQRELAEKFGVSQSNVSRALTGKQWAHV